MDRTAAPAANDRPPGSLPGSGPDAVVPSVLGTLRDLVRWRRARIAALVADAGADPGTAPQTAPTDAAAGDGPATPLEPAADAESEAETPAPPPPGEPLGRAALPAVPSEAARRTSQAGLTAHGAGDFEKSRERFAKALEEAPGYDVARFNLACALARLDRFAEAVVELEGLLRRDLPTFGPRLAEDPDLEALRTAPEGQGLQALARALRDPWIAAVQSGIPVVARVSGRWQAGAYLVAEQRFVPVTPWTGKILTAGIDPDAGHAFTIEGRDDWGDCSEYFADATVRVFSMRTLEEVADAAVLDRAFSIDMGLEATGLALRWGDVTESKLTEWKRVPFGGGAAPDGEVQPTRPYFDIGPHGTLILAEPPEGVVLQNNGVALPGRARPLALGRGHAASENHVLLPSPDGRWLVVASSNGSCDYDLSGGTRHFVDLVDIHAGKVTRLSEGDGAAYVRFDAQGGLLLQTRATLRRWTAPDAREPETLLDGILLVEPYVGPDCGA